MTDFGRALPGAPRGTGRLRRRRASGGRQQRHARALRRRDVVRSCWRASIESSATTATPSSSASIVAFARGERFWKSDGINYTLNGERVQLALQLVACARAPSATGRGSSCPPWTSASGRAPRPPCASPTRGSCACSTSAPSAMAISTRAERRVPRRERRVPRDARLPPRGVDRPDLRRGRSLGSSRRHGRAWLQGLSSPSTGVLATTRCAFARKDGAHRRDAVLGA